MRATRGALDSLIGKLVLDGSSDAHLLPTLVWNLISSDKMSLEELYFGIKLGAGNLTSPLQASCSIDQATMVRFILHASKGLLALNLNRYYPNLVTRQHPFQFIHESVREHILAGKLAALSPKLASNGKAESHAIATEWCLTYI